MEYLGTLKIKFNATDDPEARKHFMLMLEHLGLESIPTKFETKLQRLNSDSPPASVALKIP